MFLPQNGQVYDDGAMVLNGVIDGPGGLSARDRYSNPGLFRPFIPPGERDAYVIVNTGRWTLEKGVRTPIRQRQRVIDLLNQGVINDTLLTANDTALRKEAWIYLDSKIFQAYRQRLTAWTDLLAMSSIGGFNAYSHLTYEYEAMSDPGEAVMDMDGISEAQRNDGPLNKLRSIPLPIVHSAFSFSDRQLAVSRRSGSPLDTIMSEACGRRNGEFIEKTLLGVTGGGSGFSYGGQTAGVTAHDTSTGLDTGAALGASSIYGYTTFPHRNTKTNFTVPTTTNGPTTYAEVLAAMADLRDNNFCYGPYVLYHSTDWTQYMDSPFSTAGGNHPGETLRTMLMKNPDIQAVKRLDFLTSTFTMIFVDTRAGTVSAINGMDVTTTQWSTRGNKQINFDVAVIQVPLFRSDYARRCGLLHGTTA